MLFGGLALLAAGVLHRAAAVTAVAVGDAGARCTSIDLVGKLADPSSRCAPSPRSSTTARRSSDGIDPLAFAGLALAGAVLRRRRRAPLRPARRALKEDRHHGPAASSRAGLSSRASASYSVRPESRHEQVRERRRPARAPARADRATCAACARARRCWASATRVDGEAVRDTPQPLGVLVAEAVGVDGVDDDQVEPASDRAGSRARARAPPPPPSPRGARRRRSPPTPGRGGSRAARGPACRPSRAARPRPLSAAREHAEGMARRRCVGHHEVEGRASACRARSIALPIVTSSFAPGAAATKWANACERVSTATAAAPPGWRRSHSSSASCGSTDSDHRPPASRPLVDGQPFARTRARAGPSRRGRTRSRVRPRAAAASPSAAATVVLPAPPLPVT